MKKLLSILLSVAIAISLFAGIRTDTQRAQAADTEGIGDFKIVGYMPNWYGNSVLDTFDFSQVTHLIYAFAIPTADGTILSLDDGGFMEALVAKAHANGVKVSIAIGGWSYNDVPLEEAFTAATNTEAKCKTLADSMLAVVDQYGLDGIDVDWEHPNSTTKGQFETLIKYLRQGLDARGDDKYLTVAAPGNYTVGYSQTAISMLDWVNVMAYDGDSGSGHSPYSYAVSSVETWKNMGLSSDKIVLGVPFYERPNWMSYKQIVALDPSYAYQDTAVIDGTTVYYNGLNTIADKTAYACDNAGGIMIWDMGKDTTNKELSLLNKIYTTAEEKLGTSTTTPVMTDVSMSQTAVLTPGIAYNTSGSMAPATAGAYTDYFIDVQDAGTYTITYSVQGVGDGTGYTNAVSVYTGEPGTRNLSTTAASTVSIPVIWTAETVKIKVPVTLQAGEQVIRIASNAAGYTFVQAEIAKQAETAVNLAAGQSVTIGADAFGASAGKYVLLNDTLEYTVAGNAFDYNVTVANAGTYNLSVNYAVESVSNVAFQFDTVINGAVTTLGTVSAPATGAWSAYSNTEQLAVTLPAGSYVLRVTLVGDSANVKSVGITRSQEVETTAPTETSTEESSSESAGETTAPSISSNDYVYDAQTGTVTFTLNNSASEAIIYLAAYSSESEASAAYNTAMEALPGISLPGHAGYFMTSANGVHTYTASMAAGTWFVYGFNALGTSGFETWKIGVAQAASVEESTEAPTETTTEVPAETSTEAPTESSIESSSESSEESSETIVTPSKVTGVQAVYVNGQIQLTWDDNGAAQYRVMRFDGITPGYTTLTYRATADGYVDTDLIDVHRYYYRICGYFYDAEGNLVQGGVSDAAGIVATDRDPSKVENVTAVVSDGTVTLTWDAADGVRYYKIARAYGATAAEGSYACLQYNVEETTYTDTGVSAGTWRYKVVGYYKAVDNSWVYGDMSDTLFLTVQ